MTNQGDLYLFRLNEGDIMPDPRVALIFSGRGWLNDYVSLYAVVDFVNSLSNSPWWAINTEYTGNGRRVGSTVRLEGWTIDPDTPYAYVSRTRARSVCGHGAVHATASSAVYRY
jgi:hypothetical protein